jgi:hypothetical protein
MLLKNKFSREMSKFNIEEIFSPGNLVHGTVRTQTENLESFLTKGICTGEEINYKGYTRHLICLSLLNELSLPDRYLNAKHYGPRHEDRYYVADSNRMAIVVSREKVLKKFPKQTFAVGKNFRTMSALDWFWKGKVLQNLSVYDIPIRKPVGPHKYVLDDEVRVYPSKVSSDMPVIDPEMFLGLVVLPSTLEFLYPRFNSISFNLELPIFSPQGELLTII